MRRAPVRWDPRSLRGSRRPKTTLPRTGPRRPQDPHRHPHEGGPARRTSRHLQELNLLVTRSASQAVSKRGLLAERRPGTRRRRCPTLTPSAQAAPLASRESNPPQPPPAQCALQRPMPNACPSRQKTKSPLPFPAEGAQRFTWMGDVTARAPPSPGTALARHTGRTGCRHRGSM